MKIVIHPHVDLDACACVALAGVPVDEVYFLPANATKVPDELAGARILDHDLGWKGASDSQGGIHAAALSMPEAAELLGSDLLAEIDEQDRFGQVQQPRFSLGMILAGLRRELAAEGLEGEVLDRAILRVMVPILRGLIRLERQRRQGEANAVPLPTVQIGTWKFALRHAPMQEPIADMALAGCVGVVWADGLALGVTRYPGQTEPDLTRLAPFLPGWFIHPAGFLACWGSRKAPATSPPPPGTPQTLDELVQLLQSLFSTGMNK
ncbi:MAG: hypothetical protein NZ602_15025 [Thermoguttaceae bacterium]|nr:hypothetical protein [Thermoguttaceae bacterium]MDW8037102.1 hypothetical protein [Thermoguttaceae bacterium]